MDARLSSEATLTGWIPEFPKDLDRTPYFDTLTANVESLRQELASGRLRSTQILEEYQRSIIKHNGFLNAVYELSPTAMDRAQEMDAKRSEGRLLGPFHGIPVIVKDNVGTLPNLGMGTIAGSVALIGSEPAANATIVDRLLDAGAIIFAKATLSEMSYFKGEGIRCGWSAAAGHGQSAYVRGGLDMHDGTGGHSSPGGSSSGSAIAASAGLAPIAIGTETQGSLTMPSTRASLYTVRATLGIVPQAGIIPISARYDIAGPMGKTVQDIADMLTVLVDKGNTKVTEGGYRAAMTKSWSNIKVGTLDPEVWLKDDDEKPINHVPHPTTQMKEETLAAYAKIKSLAKAYHENLELRPVKDFETDGTNALWTVLTAEFKPAIDAYLRTLKSTKITSLQALVDYNASHVKEALTDEYPSQSHLVSSLTYHQNNPPSKTEAALAHIASVAQSFDGVMRKHDLDVIIGPGDSDLSAYSAARGIPIATLPLSTLDYNGRPFGLLAIAPPHKEATLIQVMSAWEASFEGRRAPEEFLRHAYEGGG